MNDSIQKSYDDLPYLNLIFPQAQPDTLLPIARLYGIPAVSPERCRVLELGCAAGANLVAMATRFPDGRFVGYDLSPKQVELARAQIERLGLANLEITQMDLTRIPADIGEFDVIIAHGIWSWVPPFVQDALFGVCRDHLSANGIAYVSYNCLPGWYPRLAIREQLLRHVPPDADPATRLRAARRVLEECVAATRADSGPCSAQLTELLSHVLDGQDAYVFHEYLEGDNRPVYFAEFARRARACGLQYLTEVPLRDALDGRLPAAWQDVPRQTAEDRLQLEQDVDFITNRVFRQTLVCHAGAAARLRPALDPGTEFWLSTEFKHVTREDGAVTYAGYDRQQLVTADPLLIAAFDHLAAVAPQRVAAESVVAHALRAGMRSESDAGRARLLLAIDTALEKSLLRAWLNDPPRAPATGDRLWVSEYVRAQAESGAYVLSPFREPLRFNGLARVIVARLDGRYDRAQLRESFLPEVRDGSLVLLDGDREVDSPGRALELIEQEIDVTVRELRRHRLLA